MEAKDLRIRNLIYSMGSIVKVNGEMLYALDSGKVKPTDFYGVELSEEWLLKLGFIEIEQKLYCQRWRLNRVDVYKMISGRYPFYFRFNQVDLKVKYVNQLQNLYFALTNTELTINKGE